MRTVMDGNTIALVTIAALNALTAFFAYRTHQTSIDTNKNVKIVEKATNSMKDALVASTAKASHAEGELKGRSDSRNEAWRPRQSPSEPK
jgi:hypothetical protein